MEPAFCLIDIHQYYITMFTKEGGKIHSKSVLGNFCMNIKPMFSFSEVHFISWDFGFMQYWNYIVQQWFNVYAAVKIKQTRGSDNCLLFFNNFIKNTIKIKMLGAPILEMENVNTNQIVN